MTLATTRAYVQRLIESEPQTDSLSALVAAAATSMSVNSSTSWKKGEIAEEQTAGEQVLVTADGVGGTVSIRKGHNGTTDAQIASGVILHKNPRFSWAQIDQAIATRVDGLWPGVWVVSTTTITPSTTADIYNVPTDYKGFLSLGHAQTGSVTEIRSPSYVEEISNVATAILASGMGLRIRGWHRSDQNATLYYKAKATTANMPAALERAVAHGAAEELLENEAAKHAGDGSEQGQGKVRSALTASRFQGARFNDLIRSYEAGLQYAHPVRRYVRPRWIGA